MQNNLKNNFLNKKILDILVCPLCKGKLQFDKNSQELICKFDKLAYQIRDGVPVMLVDEAKEI